MTDVEYDSAAMRQAMNKLKDVYERLKADQSRIHQLSATRQPGRSDHTSYFHRSLMTSIDVFHDNHNARMQEVAEALNTLQSIDHEYNNGELVNELNLHYIKLDGKD